MMSLLKRIWRGEFSLNVTFWGFGLGGYVCGELTVLFFRKLFQGMGIQYLVIVFLLALWAYMVLVSVGIWRSAATYRGPQIWVQSARIGLVAFLVCWLLALTWGGAFEAYFAAPE